MSTIILYKNNKCLKLPLLKFISNKKKYRPDTPLNIKPIKKIIESRKETLKENTIEKPIIVPSLLDLPSNSEKFILNKSKEEAVQTIQTSFRINDNSFIKKHTLNIFNNERTIYRESNIKDNDSIIDNEKIYKLGNKNRRKLLENYSQINYYFNNVHNKNGDNLKSKFLNLKKINRPKILSESKVKIFRNIENNKINPNKTLEKTEDKVQDNFENLFHNQLLVNNINKAKKQKLIKENIKKDINKIKSNMSYNKSLPNIFMNLNKQVIYKLNKYKLLKSNGRFLPKKMIFKKESVI